MASWYTSWNASENLIIIFRIWTGNMIAIGSYGTPNFSNAFFLCWIISKTPWKAEEANENEIYKNVGIFKLLKTLVQKSRTTKHKIQKFVRVNCIQFLLNFLCSPKYVCSFNSINIYISLVKSDMSSTVYECGAIC